MTAPDRDPLTIAREVIRQHGDLDRDALSLRERERLTLARAVVAVADLHKPITDGSGFTDEGGYGSINPACSSCGTGDEYAVPWPCPTITAIAATYEEVTA